ncbi:MAG: hypothetical protein HKO81_02910 [Flavobacteriaceae bacterium]|nr:hypothetical protein [Bacteroidia bacterium]NNL15573.1 hypothetical protein [Flavobacteriaceae bacterium]
MKFRNYILIFTVLLLGFYSCGSDDDEIVTIPPRDRAEQYLIDIDSIEEYLSTHFYNYEEFQLDPNSSSFEIEFDTIAGLNIDKTPLIDQVEYKMLTDVEDVEYKLYYLKVREGLGETSTFGDSTYVRYIGSLIDSEVFDSSPVPVWFELPNVVQGFREGIIEFNGATGFSSNGDGTFSYDNFGIGAIFIPSGLGYFNSPISGTNAYDPLIFRFHVLGVNEADRDGDGVINIHEDLDGDRNLFSDDTDGDLIPNYADPDDDGDNILTINEDLDEDGDPRNDDSDNDGIPNYLDEDSTVSNLD